MTRDQQRALAAYETLEQVVAQKNLDNFASLVNGLGAQIIRTGLSPALAFAARYRDRAASDALFEHLSRVQIPGLKQSNPITLITEVSKLDVRSYMLATRETLKVILWLKRAIQAYKVQAS